MKVEGLMTVAAVMIFPVVSGRICFWSLKIETCQHPHFVAGNI